MSDVCVLTNGVLVTGGLDPRIIKDGAVAWRGDRIVEVGEGGELAARYPEARVLDARGGLILPGLVNKGTLKVIPAFYDLETGWVEWLF